jgi:hypothetical protein
MKSQELFNLAKEIFEDCLETLKKKNHDYATGENIEVDALKNFNLVEHLGLVNTPTGILVRICDKISRLVNVYEGKNKVKEESCQDTAKDLINYTVILLATLKEKNKETKNEQFK